MAEFTTAGEYEAKMNAQIYLDTYFQLGSGSLADDFIRFALRKLHEVFSSGAVKGSTLIDVGTAPSIYQLLSSCEAFDDITATWFTQSELRLLQKWQNKEPDAFDWTSILTYVCELEGNKVTPAEKEEKLRGKIKRVSHCDVGKGNPLAPAEAPKADCVTATVCLEAACKSFESYGLALRHLANLLKPKGYLLLAGDLGANYYEVGAEKVFSLPVNEKFLREALSGNGYHIVELETRPVREDRLVGGARRTEPEERDCFLATKKQNFIKDTNVTKQSARPVRFSISQQCVCPGM
ncbi:PREDICTED: nicotinamide N-methyltransferase-like [Nanorana parkeri]|uniref:nicotinamide N-methyltransferase-like n=1 Tax=Nanorana parkeri TaxID=125878 RepID=UPI000854D600|nr:PREDICTED: nicotinamide N-methyltransferase-like [Nanorana parkeri]